MNVDTHAKVAALSCGHDHAVQLVEDDGTLFLENDAVEHYKLKRDETRPVGSRVYPSRSRAIAKGMPLENPRAGRTLRGGKGGNARVWWIIVSFYFRFSSKERANASGGRPRDWSSKFRIEKTTSLCR